METLRTGTTAERLGREYWWYWLPVVDGDGRMRRHAFEGRRWEGQPRDVTRCGAPAAMARPSELDWVTAPSCLDCRDRLLSELSTPEPQHP